MGGDPRRQEAAGGGRGPRRQGAGGGAIRGDRRPAVGARSAATGGRRCYEASVVLGCLRIRYAAPAPAPNSATSDTPVASQVAPSHWPPK